MIDNPSYSHYATHDESEYPELWRGVRGYWAPCLGPSGTRLHDVSGRGNWGTLTNMDAATDWVVDDGKYALDLDGVNDRIDIPIGGAIGLIDFSFFGWVKVRGSADAVLWNNRSNGWSLIFFRNSTTTVFFRGENLGANCQFSVPSLLNRWASVCITRKNGIVRCFVNGVESTTGSLTYSDQVVFNEIGRSAASSSFFINAIIDDQIFWSQALSTNEITQLHQIGRGGMLTPRRRRRAYFAGVSGLRRRLLLTGQV